MLSPRDWDQVINPIKSFFTALIGKNKDAGTDTLFGYVADKETQAAIYNALGNGSGIIKSIQRGALSFSGSAQGTATINEVDVNKAIVLYGGSTWNCSVGASGIGKITARVMLANSTTVRINLGSGDSSYGSIVPYQVVEFY